MSGLADISGLWGDFSDWATGRSAANPDGYHTLIQCLSHDYFWIGLTVFLNLAVAAGYIAIAYHWYKNQRNFSLRSPAHIALSRMKKIFIFCALCGYVFIPVKMFWPAWRIYDVLLMILVFYVWKYAINVSSLRVIYAELGRAEQLTRDLEALRTESQRKTQFLNAISHDLRTPLNGIVLQSHMAESAIKSQDEGALRQSLGEIRAAAVLTANVLNQLLHYAHLDSDHKHPTTFSLHMLLTEVAALHRPAAQQKGLQLSVHLNHDGQITTDREKLQRLLNNLVENAVKYTSAGSVEVRSRLDPHSDMLTFDIIDTGCGIAVEHQSRLFQEFFQPHNPQRDPAHGMGLGLAIARRLAEQLGGTLTVQSSPTQGSTFSFSLPNAGSA